MAFIDATVVNVMLPELQASLAASVAQIQWVVEAYTLFLAALLLLGGALGDRYGRRRILTLGITLFTLASLACALAPDADSLITLRALQGVGAALLIPGSLAIISVCFPHERRGRAIGLWSGFSAVASGMGLVLGGLLIDLISWRAVFALNLPVAAVTLGLLYRFVPESARPAPHPPLDITGALLSVIALGGLILGLIAASGSGFLDPGVLLPGAIGLLAMAFFIRHERRCPSPMLAPHLFGSRTFRTVSLLTFLFYAALGTFFFLLPMTLVQIHGFSATAAGAATLPIIILMSLLSGRAGRLIDRYGARRPLTIGPLIVAAGLGGLLLAGTEASYWHTFLPSIALMGAGMVTTVAPLTATVMASVADSDAGTASGINNAIARTAGLMGIALFGPVLYLVFRHALLERLAPLALPDSIRNALVTRLDRLAALPLPEHLSAEQALRLRQLIEHSFVLGFDSVIIACMALMMAASATAAIGLRPTTPDER